jgi:hypothetical protein
LGLQSVLSIPLGFGLIVELPAHPHAIKTARRWTQAAERYIL